MKSLLSLKQEDKILLQRIKSRIRWDIRVSNYDVNISVIDGKVVLSGYFDEPYRHEAAVNIISSIEGIKGFEDKAIVLGDYYRTDRELETIINKQLMKLPLIKDEWLDVEVCDGIAKLEGHVYRSKFKAYAARSAWELSGIKDCINLIDLRDWPSTIEATTEPVYATQPLAS